MGKSVKFFLWALMVTISLAPFGGVRGAYAETILFDRGLPIYNDSLTPPSNLNGIGNTNRSNFTITYQYTSVQPTTYQIGGDDFTIGQTGQTFQITKVRVWMIWGSAGSQYGTTPIATPSASLTLWSGPPGNINFIPATPTLTRIWYSDGSNYQRTSDGNWRGVWQIDFAVNLKITGGQKYQFFLNGLFLNSGGVWQSPSLCSAKEALSNNPHRDGADNVSWVCTMANGTPSGFSAIFNGMDANVQVFGEIVAVAPGVTLLLLDK